MTFDQIAAFFVFSFVAAITPGPSNVMLVAAGAIDGFVKGLGCLAGINLGMALMMFVVTFGLGQLILDHPSILASMNYLGAAFLLWLAYKIATAPTHQTGTTQKTVGFFGAAAFQWVNPKSWLVCTSAAGTYLDAGAGNAVFQAIVFATTFSLAALPCALVWLGFGATVQYWLRTERANRYFNWAMASLLAASVLLVFR